MNNTLLALLVSTLLPGTLPQARAQSITQGIDNKMSQSIEIERGSLGAALIELSAKSGLDVLVDATHISTASSTQGEKTYLLNAIQSLAVANGLSWLRRDEYTLLLWSTPNPDALARALTRRYQRGQGANLALAVQNNVLTLGEEAWKSAAFVLAHDKPKNQPSSDYLALRVAHKGSGTLMGMSYVDLTARKVAPSTGSRAHSAASQATPQQATTFADPTPGEAARGLDAFDLKRDVALGTRVAAEFRRLTLPDALAALGKQTGTSLLFESPDGKAATRLLTGRVAAAPLWQVMDDLRHLFHLRWSKDDQGRYVARLRAPGGVSEALVQLGNMQSLLAIRSQERRRQWAEITNEVLALASTEALQSKQGVLLASLPASLQKRVREVAEAEGALGVLEGAVGGSRIALAW